MKPEILAPVGSIESFYAAIAYGANAVYLGLPKFQARAKTQVFTPENIKEYVAYAHAFDVKVYLTLNTLVTNEEWNDMLQTVDIAMQAGIDAFILQDLGVAQTIKHKYPTAILHASTQMGICNVQGAKIAQDLGFSRVVLARETTLEDIEAIKKQTDLEIEYFVQGALCVAYSGACYLSSLTNGNSGNRGACKQLCRMPICVQHDKTQKQGYYLSTADLSLQQHLQEVVNAGVCSLKIEGRLRRPAYVAEAVRTFRQMVDHNFAIEPNGLQQAFYRGTYNDGEYLHPGAQAQHIISPAFANHRGVLIGTIYKVEPFKDLYKIYIASNKPIQNGDGLKCVNEKGECSFGVGNVGKEGKHYVVYSTTKPQVQDKVYKILDAAWEDTLLQKKPALPLHIYIEAAANLPLQVTATCKNKTYTFTSSFITQEAKTAPLTETQVVEVFEKKDTYPFAIQVKANVKPFFATKAQLNEFRRHILQQVWQNVTFTPPAVAQVYTPTMYIPPKDTTSYILTNHTEHTLQPNQKCIFAPNKYSLKEIQKALQSYKPLTLWLPVICNGKDMLLLESILKTCNAKDVTLVMNNIGQIAFAKHYPCIAGPTMNVSNNYTAAVLKTFGITQFIRSYENIFSSVKGGLSYCGNVPVMQFAHCPWQAVYGNDCAHCTYTTKPLQYTLPNGICLRIRRMQLTKCYAEAVWMQTPQNPTSFYNIIDIRT